MQLKMVLRSRQDAHRLSSENKKQSDIWQRQRRSFGGKSQSASAELMGSRYRDASLSPHRKKDYNVHKQAVGEGCGRFWSEMACGRVTAAVSLQIRREVLKEENVNAVDKLINIARGVLWPGGKRSDTMRCGAWGSNVVCALFWSRCPLLVPIISCHFLTVSIN